MNKKGAVEITVGTIVTIILLLSAICLGLVITKITLQKPSYNITQEVCHNESGYKLNDSVLSYQCTRKGYGVELYTSNLSEIERWIYEGVCDGKNEFFTDYYIETEKEVCFPQEVDFLEYIDNQTYHDCCDKKGVSLESLEGMFCIYDAYINISKEDLTKEWLDENCECTTCWSEIKDLGTMEGECNNRYPEKLEICSQYKCGNFTVEVL